MDLPSYIANIVDIGIQNADINYITDVGFLMMIMVAISVFATIAISYFSSRVSSGYAKDLRKVVYSNVLKFSNHELNKISRSSLITRSTNDINQLQNLLSMMLICFQDCFSFNAHYDLIFKSDDSSNIIFWAYDAIAGNILTGDIIAFIQYSTQVVFSFIMLGGIMIILPRFLVSARRVAEVLNMELSLNEGLKIAGTRMQ